MNRIHAREALRIEQTAVNDLRNRAHSVIRTKEIAGTGLVSFRIRSSVFMLHKRIPDSGRHLHLVWSKRLQAKLESLTLALRIPDFERLLAISRHREWNF